MYTQNKNFRKTHTFPSSPINHHSLIEFSKKSSDGYWIESYVANKSKLRIVSSDEFIDAYLPRLAYVGIDNIRDLNRLLSKKKSFVRRFVAAWYSGSKGVRHTLLPEGIGISFLCWAIALEKGGLPFLQKFIKKHAFNTDRDTTKLAHEIEEAYKKAHTHD